MRPRFFTVGSQMSRAVIVCSLGWLLTLSAGDLVAAPPKRAKPPAFPPSVVDAFFPDARQKLQGTRPPRPAEPQASADVPRAPSGTKPADAAGDWQQAISAEALEDEIKAQQQQLADGLASPVKFKGGGYQQARVQFSLLAVLFAIDAQYGADVRWQRDAAAMRSGLARAGFNCKVGTDASYQEAKARLQDLETVIRGEAPGTTASGEVSWPQIADRPPLMKRLEEAVDGRLGPWTADAAAFSRHREQVAHEAQLVAALANVIGQAGYESADDATYREIVAAMREGALSLRDAAEQNQPAQARQAVGEIKKACGNCHEGFRN